MKKLFPMLLCITLLLNAAICFAEGGAFSYRFADAEEAAELLLSNRGYYDNLTQNDLNYRMQKLGATLEELEAFSAQQTRDWTDEEKTAVDTAMAAIEQTCEEHGYSLPATDGIVFAKTTMLEECDAAAYTHGTQIYLGEGILKFGKVTDPELQIVFREIVAHELFHCLTRNHPDFRADMYGILGFTVVDEDYDFAPNVKELIISNPDVGHHNSYASFDINGEMKDCAVIFTTAKTFEQPGDNFFDGMVTGLVPVDDLSVMYTSGDAENFTDVFGMNTDYVIDPEETMADNFAYTIVYGFDRDYETPELIEAIDSHLKSRQVTPAESFYGYVNQEFFAEFDSGIEGSHVDPLYGELITDDPELEFSFDKLIDRSHLVEVVQADAAVAEIFEGEGPYQQGTAAQRVYDLYDSLKHAADDRAADEALFMSWVDVIARADDPAQFIDAVKAIYRETGVNVLYDITAAQDKTNTTYVKARMTAPLDGARVALDPEMTDKYMPLYRAAMADAVSSLGLEASQSDIEEACRLQAAFNLGYSLLEKLEETRSERTWIPEENYTRDDYKADRQRLELLYPDADYTAPEELNETDAEIYLNLIYAGQMFNTLRLREELDPVLCSILDDAGFVYDQVIVVEEDLAAMTAVTDENLTAFKVNAILRLAEQLPFVPSAAAEPMQRMKRAADCAFWGSDTAPETEEDLSDEALQAGVLTLLPQDKGLIWAEKYYDPALAERVAVLTDRIKAAYAARIEKNEWLGQGEKEMMIAKLDNMITIIGIPTEENCVFPVITSRAEGGSLLVNRTALKRAELQKTLRMVNEVDYARRAYDQLISFTPMFFNAAMFEAVDNTAMNTIIIPAGIIVNAADPEDETAFEATLGTIVAHEIGHAFDAGGSLHNEKGAFENWWSEASRAEFHRLEKIFDAQYSRFPMVEGMYHNFSGNMQENMADFAGMEAVLDLAGDDPDTLRSILEAYASELFVAVSTRASLEEYTNEFTADNHAYKSIRVNALVSSLDRFYELYDVKEGDPMYTAPEARPHLW